MERSEWNIENSWKIPENSGEFGRIRIKISKNLNLNEFMYFRIVSILMIFSGPVKRPKRQKKLKMSAINIDVELTNDQSLPISSQVLAIHTILRDALDKLV